MSIIEEGDDDAGEAGDRHRPWWFIPGLAAVGIGALVGGLFGGTVRPSSPGPSHAAASPRVVTAPPPYSGLGTWACPSCRVVTGLSPTARPSGTFAPVLRPARVFEFDEFYDRGTPPFSLVPRSRYVLYDDGSFELQYAVQPPIEEQRGTYTEADGVIGFKWPGMLSNDGRMEATGHLTGNLLRVQYSWAMLGEDGSDLWAHAIYVRR